MTFKAFSKFFLYVILILILVIVSVNIYLNEFGLFGNVKGKNYRIYGFERASKYLLSFNYVPSNFDGILVGPSFSDIMMDTKQLEDYKVYNLSINGGNISELKYSIDNVLKYGDIKVFIICLDPYITQNSGLKTSEIDFKQYYSTLGSLFTLKYYIKKIQAIYQGEKNIYYDSYWGYRYNDRAVKDINSTLRINQPLSTSFNINVDEIAYKELMDILEEVRKREIQIIAYYYPKPKRVFENKGYKPAYRKYKEQIDLLLDYNQDVVINYNQDKYNYIRNLESSYSDGSHLSEEGATKILSVLNKNILSIRKKTK